MSKRPQFVNRARSKSTGSESRGSHLTKGTSDTDDDSDDPRTTHTAVSDRDDNMKAMAKTHYRTPAPDKSKKSIKHKVLSYSYSVCLLYVLR